MNRFVLHRVLDGSGWDTRRMREANNDHPVSAEMVHDPSEALYHSLVESLPGHIFRKDSWGRFTFANGRFCAMLGRPLAEVIGKTDFDLYPPELAEKYRLDDRHVLLTGEPIEAIEQHGTAGGHRRYVQVVKTAVRNQDGRIIGTQGVCWDVTERGCAEEALLRERNLLEKAEQALRANEDELRVGRRIQQGLYPRTAPNVAGFDIAGASFPAAATGGDYFDFVPMKADCLGVVVGDASGHGVGPALLSASTRAYLRAIALTYTDAGEILTRTNQLLSGDISEDHFVTLFLGRLSPHTQSFAYASAGHQTGYVFDASGALKHRLRSTGLPLGVDPSLPIPSGPTILFEQGDLLLLVTDGIAEATASDERMFQIDRALAVVLAHRHRSSQEIVEALYQAARDFCQPCPPQDDVTAVVIKAVEPTGHGSLQPHAQ